MVTVTPEEAQAIKKLLNVAPKTRPYARDYLHPDNIVDLVPELRESYFKIGQEITIAAEGDFSKQKEIFQLWCKENLGDIVKSSGFKNDGTNTPYVEISMGALNRIIKKP